MSIYISPGVMLQSGADFSLASVASHAIGSPESGRPFILSEVIILCTEAPTILGLCAITIGSNSSSYNNLVPATLLAGLDAVNKVLVVPVPATVLDTVDGDEIRVRVSVPSTTGGRAYVFLAGYYRDEQ